MNTNAVDTTTDYRDQCLALLQTMKAPRNQNWEAEWGLYDRLLSIWGEPLSRAVVQNAVLNLEWRPSPVELRTIAAKLASPYPDVDEALEEVVTLIRRYGKNAAPHPDFPNRPNMRAAGEPKFSHPLVLATVRRLGGWRSLCDGDAQYQEGGLQGAFRRIYERAEQDWVQEVRGALESGTRPVELFPDYKPFEGASLLAVAREVARDMRRPVIAPSPAQRLQQSPLALQRSVSSLREYINKLAEVRQLPSAGTQEATQ